MPAVGQTGVTSVIWFCAVEHHDDSRPHQDRVREFPACPGFVRQALDQPHHVVAEIAEQAGGHRRSSAGRSIRLSASSEQGLKRRLAAGLERLASTRARRLISTLSRLQRQIQVRLDR